ncbi:MAG: hybrid sensor histidine kinase/response regulator [Leptolyngbyaceae bacterium]|nr:hybrid sensor histidine kinase/response regulator [Leptolyngbyaceae bacterium]
MISEEKQSTQDNSGRNYSEKENSDRPSHPARVLPSDPIVLLVDDNPINLRMLFDALGDAGFRLLAAESGEVALEQVTLCLPDIILLDVMMPGLDGFETCRRLKADPMTADIPIIFMTALADTVNKIQGLSMGAVDYITKPIQPDEILARIRTHLTIAELRQQLQAQNEQLRQEIQDRKQIEQSLRLLLRSVSHDLRNPVSGMIMVLNNLLDQASHSTTVTANVPPSPSDSILVPRRILAQMASSSDRQLHLINSLLETHTLPQNLKSKIQNLDHPTLQLELHRKSVAIAPLIDNIIQELQPLLEDHLATITYQLADTLPPANVDPAQLWRVLENLITNAIKHNPSGVEVGLTVFPEPAEPPSSPPKLRFTVQDNGTGIAPGEQETLFAPYQRGTEVGQTPGLGLGLYLCQQIVTAHGGEIGVSSQLQQGATFWFTIPSADG